MNKTANKQVMCDTLINLAKKDKDIVALTSDSRGSASMAKFAEVLPEQFVEVGIAEQNIVGIAAGLAVAGKKPFVTSYAPFLSMRSIEQIKVDVAYSKVNAKIVGISGGVSYGSLGMSHHALQDIAVMMAIPNIKVLMPSDRYVTKKTIEALVNIQGPAYIRLGRNPVSAVYSSFNDLDDSDNLQFEIGKAITARDGNDITLIGTGEMVQTAVKAAKLFEDTGISCRVLDMHTLKPLDEKAIIKAAKETGYIITIEEHSIYGGLGAAVSQVVAQNHPVPVEMMAIPDQPVVSGTPEQIFEYYGLTAESILETGQKLLKR